MQEAHSFKVVVTNTRQATTGYNAIAPQKAALVSPHFNNHDVKTGHHEEESSFDECEPKWQSTHY